MHKFLLKLHVQFIELLSTSKVDVLVSGDMHILQQTYCIVLNKENLMNKRGAICALGMDHKLPRISFIPRC